MHFDFLLHLTLTAYMPVYLTATNILNYHNLVTNQNWYRKYARGCSVGYFDVLTVLLFLYFRICTIRSVDGSNITSYCVHECDASSRMGSRPRRFLITGHSNGCIQVRNSKVTVIMLECQLEVQDVS